MSIPIFRTANPLFGKPVLVAANSGKVAWVKNTSLSQFQKGTGWQAELYGGTQSGDDWAACYIPVDEIYLPDFNYAQWSWYQTAAETMGLGMVIWIHDPNDFDKRAEVTQLANVSGLDKSAGWNSHEWNKSTVQMFFYGENTSGTGLTAGTQYAWTSFQTDALFKNWTIYRISFDWGWEASGTFESPFLADVKLNGVIVSIRPDETELLPSGSETKTLYKATSGTSSTVATAITPTVGKKVRIKNIFMATASNTAANFEVYFATGANLAADTSKAIAIVNLDTDVRLSEQVDFGEKGPVGLVDEVVSIRTSADITTNGTFVFVYREE